MALTTRALVLQRLGLTDDASAAGAIMVALKGVTLTQCVFAVDSSQTTLTITPTPGSATVLTLTSSGADTMGEVVSSINALSGLEASLVSGVSGSTASTLLTASQSITLTSSNELDELTYTNVASGTVAAFVDSCVLAAQAAIGRHCGRLTDTLLTNTFESGTYTETVDGTGEQIISLRNFPVTSITSITHIDDSGVETVLPASDYRLDSRTGNVYRLAGGWTAWDSLQYEGPAYNRGVYPVWEKGFNNYRVVYVGGYTSVPADLQDTATEIAAQIFLGRRSNKQWVSDSVAARAVQWRTVDELVSLYDAQLWPYKGAKAMIG